MIEEAFSEAGYIYFANRSGANLMSGILTEFVMNSTLTGKTKKEYAVIECDEAAAKTVFGQLQPKAIVVTNLFRDQLDRYGEITHTLNSIRDGIRTVPLTVLSPPLWLRMIFRTRFCGMGLTHLLLSPPKRLCFLMRVTAFTAKASISTIIILMRISAAFAARIAATAAIEPILL